MENSGGGPESGRKPRAEPGLNQDYIRTKVDPGPSGVSLSSNRSKDVIINFKEDRSGASAQLRDDSAPYGPTTESLKSERSKDWIIDFKDRDNQRDDSASPIEQEPQAELDTVFQVCEHKHTQHTHVHVNEFVASDDVVQISVTVYRLNVKFTGEM
ncbi:hypothetical protein NL108_015720 [Boleophthalmus pectinirostris]|nr:hypothetical protein NL108_015720 [Boleophthalmus pectinirostris]